MSTIIPVSPENLAGKAWAKENDFNFAAKDAFCPIVAAEVTRVMCQSPIAFLKQGSGYSMVALQGFDNGANLLLNDQYNWTVPYIPAYYRGHPFMLADTKDGRKTLCVISSNVLDHPLDPSNTFFEADGSPSQRVQDVFTFLSGYAQNQANTQKLLEQIDTLNLIQPWPLQVSLQPESTIKIEGLYRVDFEALKSLDAASLKALQSSDALSLIYSAFFSMQHLQALFTKFKIRKSKSEPLSATNNLSGDLFASHEMENISFENL